MSEWEVRTRPFRNLRTGIVSGDELTVTAIHRERGWVLVTERMAPERLADYDPAAEWAGLAAVRRATTRGTP